MMQFYNKGLRAREGWTVIKMTAGSFSFTEMKIWCQRQESRSRFFGKSELVDIAINSGGNPYVVSEMVWWFEAAQDALHFRLIHG